MENLYQDLKDSNEWHNIVKELEENENSIPPANSLLVFDNIQSEEDLEIYSRTFWKISCNMYIS